MLVPDRCRDQTECGGEIVLLKHQSQLPSFFFWTCAQEGKKPGLRPLALWRLTQQAGCRVPMEQYRHLIQDAVLEPQVRRFVLYNSKPFRLAFAVVFYISMWANLYSTSQLFSLGTHWAVVAFVSLSAAAATVALILVFAWSERKVSVNTDTRMAVVNEALMRHNLLLGLTDAVDSCQNVLQIWVVYFNLDRCLQCLRELIQDLRSNEEPDLRRRLSQFSVVVNTELSIPGGGADGGQDPLEEEAPLLPREPGRRQSSLTHTQLHQLLPEGPPEATAQQLLTIFSGFYIRLLVTGQLPLVPATRHAEQIGTPCLCQFIEASALVPGGCCAGPGDPSSFWEALAFESNR
uniref:Transmembrane protein 268 n=1 Tax=Ornithorhynchus anatinus TaxID=9258 RepID=F7A7Q6_ORNAN